MASFNVELNSRKNKDGLYSVFIRYTENRKSRKVKLNFRVPEDHFNKQARFGKWIRIANSKSKAYNKEIEDTLEELRIKFTEIKKQSLAPLTYINKPVSNGTFITVGAYIKSYLSDKEGEATIGYFNVLSWMLNAFATYVGEDTLMVDIKPRHVAEYRALLLARGAKGSTINNTLQKIHKVFTIALKDDTISKDPFRLNEPVKEVRPSRVRLNDELIKKLSELDLTDPALDNARNYYLFSFYNAGIRIADFMQIRKGSIANGRLEYEMDKTGHKKSILLNKSALAILEKYPKKKGESYEYMFPILDSKSEYAKNVSYEDKRRMPRPLRVKLDRDIKNNARYINTALADISTLLKIPKAITFHTARHSFADKARRAMKNSNKITLVDIKNSLAHKKISTTENYWASFDEDSLDEAMEAIFE
ncbi:hypothetical protein DSL64_03305 [Dyadobacter luteus]|uniref:Tyr recombinase domain-containing protein n=1 Tax=Dyadobacter luteus TaxID=2259619 RepID=A0A3D8YFK6_9BACT|nr:tyrosine-type recombinase/integrase [Dyadobacter luteus]REA63488.1 hypothetical protein DSL64_03305 [Dyadobacter luteus]